MVVKSKERLTKYFRTDAPQCALDVVNASQNLRLNVLKNSIPVNRKCLRQIVPHGLNGVHERDVQIFNEPIVALDDVVQKCSNVVHEVTMNKLIEDVN